MTRTFTSRREFLKSIAFGAASTAILAACSPAAPPAPAAAPKSAEPAAQAPKEAASSGAAATPATVSRPLTKDKIHLVFQGHVAGGQDEQNAYDQTLAAWSQEHPNIEIEYAVVADPERIQKVTAQVAAGQAPDMWRHNHNVIRLWASQGHLLDLSDRLKGYDKLFLPALTMTCMYKGKMYGLPHTTDTSALFYRTDSLDAIGVKAPVAGEMDKAWTFEKFGEICDQLLKSGKQQYAFTHNQGGGRWISHFLYGAGAKIVSDDHTKLAINSPEGIRALAFLKSWTDKKWAPVSVWTNASMRNADTDPFCQGTTSMAIVGQWNITYLSDQIKNNFKWDVTFSPKDKVLATSMGGTPIVIWAKTKFPDECAAFYEFFESPKMLRMFDEMANYLPVRLDLGKEKINYKTRPDLMAIFQEQIKTIPENFASWVAMTNNNGVSTIITEETTKMMSTSQSPEDTAKNIETRGNKFMADNPDVQ